MGPPPKRYPSDPNFAERVAIGTEQLCREHQLVSSLAELRKQGAVLTQTEVATLLDYACALYGSLEVRTVDCPTDIKQLV